MAQKKKNKLLRLIKKIYTYKGIMIDANKNVSDILILKKMNLGNIKFFLRKLIDMMTFGERSLNSRKI